jgi:hypothetical protein
MLQLQALMRIRKKALKALKQENLKIFSWMRKHLTNPLRNISFGELRMGFKNISLKIITVWFGLMLRTTPHLDVAGTLTPLRPTVTIWWSSLVPYRLMESTLEFILQLVSGKTWWEAKGRVLKLRQFLYGTLITTTGPHLETILKLVAGVLLPLSNMREISLYVGLELTSTGIE